MRYFIYVREANENGKEKKEGTKSKNDENDTYMGQRKFETWSNTRNNVSSGFLRVLKTRKELSSLQSENSAPWKT